MFNSDFINPKPWDVDSTSSQFDQQPTKPNYCVSLIKLFRQQRQQLIKCFGSSIQYIITLCKCCTIKSAHQINTNERFEKTPISCLVWILNIIVRLLTDEHLYVDALFPPLRFQQKHTTKLDQLILWINGIECFVCLCMYAFFDLKNIRWKSIAAYFSYWPQKGLWSSYCRCSDSAFYLFAFNALPDEDGFVCFVLFGYFIFVAIHNSTFNLFFVLLSLRYICHFMCK